MADKKIGDLGAISGALDGTELIEVQTSAPASKKVTTQQIRDLNPTTPDASPVAIQFAASDETTTITTGTGKVTFRVPFAFTLTEVRASLTTASSSGAVASMLKMNGSAILSTGLTIDASEKTSATAATPAVISTSAITDDAEITVDVTSAGTDAAGLKLTLIGTKS